MHHGRNDPGRRSPSSAIEISHAGRLCEGNGEWRGRLDPVPPTSLAPWRAVSTAVTTECASIPGAHARVRRYARERVEGA